MGPSGPQEAPVQGLPPRTLPWGRPGEKNGPTGLSGQNEGTTQGKTQQGTGPREGKSSKGRGAGRKPPKTWPHWRSEARRAPFRGRQAPFFFPLGAATSPSGPRKAQEGPARHSGSRSPPNHMPGWSWRPAAGNATEGTRPCEPVRAGRTETRRALQAAAPGARTAPIMKGRGPPVRPANRPFDRRPGENRPGPSGTPQAAAVLTDARKTTENAAPPDPGRRSKGVKKGQRHHDPGTPAERPHGPGKPPSRAPSRPLSAEVRTSGNPGHWR